MGRVGRVRWGSGQPALPLPLRLSLYLTHPPPRPFAHLGPPHPSSALAWWHLCFVVSPPSLLPLLTLSQREHQALHQPMHSRSLAAPHCPLDHLPASAPAPAPAPALAPAVGRAAALHAAAAWLLLAASEGRTLLRLGQWADAAAAGRARCARAACCEIEERKARELSLSAGGRKGRGEIAACQQEVGREGKGGKHDIASRMTEGKESDNLWCQQETKCEGNTVCQQEMQRKEKETRPVRTGRERNGRGKGNKVNTVCQQQSVNRTQFTNEHLLAGSLNHS